MSSVEKFQLVVLSVVVLVSLTFATGWVVNVLKFAQLDFKAPYKAEIIRGVAIPTGIGGVVGFIKVTDK